MPSTLLTGANGFFAAHIINQLIADGHSITGTVRSLSKGDQLIALHPEWKDHLKFVEVQHLAKPGIWDAIIQNGKFDYVIHNAAPVAGTGATLDFDRDFLEPSVAGNHELLNTAQKYGPNIKNITFVGSINAITDGNAEAIANRVYTEHDWLPYTTEDARRLQNEWVSYCVAKKESEKAVWKYVETEKPHFSVTVFCPTLLFGPAFHHVDDIKNVNFTNDIVYTYIDGEHQRVPHTHFPAYIDVRDAALAHVRALTTPGAANQRFLMGNAHFSSTLAVDALRSLPEVVDRLPKEPVDEEIRTIQLDTRKLDEVFGIRYRTAEETFHDTARRLLELERLLSSK